MPLKNLISRGYPVEKNCGHLDIRRITNRHFNDTLKDIKLMSIGYRVPAGRIK